MFRIALGVVLRAVDALAARLPSLVDADGGISRFRLRDVRLAVDGPHRRDERVDRTARSVAKRLDGSFMIERRA